MRVVQSIFSVIMIYPCDTNNTILGSSVLIYSPRALMFLLASIDIIQSKLDLNRANTQHRFRRHNSIPSFFSLVGCMDRHLRLMCDMSNRIFPVSTCVVELERTSSLLLVADVYHLEAHYWVHTMVELFEVVMMVSSVWSLC